MMAWAVLTWKVQHRQWQNENGINEPLFEMMEILIFRKQGNVSLFNTSVRITYIRFMIKWILDF